MKRILITTFLMVWVFCCTAGGAFAFELEDLLLNLYSKDGDPGITLKGGTIETGWAFPLDVEGTQINNSIASEIANLSLNSSVASFSVEIDPTTGLPLVTTEALGPIYTERAQTLGKGVIKFGGSATYVKFTEFEGDDLGGLNIIIDHIDFPGDNEYEKDKLDVTLDIEIEEYIVALYASYGVFDRLDASVIVPFVSIDMKIDAHAEIIRIALGSEGYHAFSPTEGDSPDDSVSGDAYGIGDIIFRLKYFWREFKYADVSFAADTKVPTGDKENLLGADAFTFAPFVIFSKTFYDGRFNPHLNFGYEINFDDDKFSQLKYAIGFDSRVTRMISFAVDLIGNNELSGDDVGDDIYDLSTGVKFNPWRDLVFFANVQFPLNNEGLRADFVPSFGAEYSF